MWRAALSATALSARCMRFGTPSANTEVTAMSNQHHRVAVALAALLAVVAPVAAIAQPIRAEPIKNVVLVHGAWVDGSGWRQVHDILVGKGYHVTEVQEPETSFAADVNATRRILDLQDGPTLLVGHSYGGSIVTEAGIHPKVVGLVYVAAHAPDVGEDEGTLGKRMPNVLGQTPGAIARTPDGYTYLEPPPSRRRAGSHTTVIEGASHSVYESHAAEVAAMIDNAAQQVGSAN
jgi:pimeloyl-ACP methyl ester carboxylesterase